MAQAIILPKLGQTVEEAAIVKWHKKEGDAVSKGDVLFEIETDKAVLEVESFYEGTLLKIIIGENIMVPVSSTVAFIGEKGEKVPEVRSQKSDGKSSQPPASSIQHPAASSQPPPQPSSSQHPASSIQPPATINHHPSAIPPPPGRLLISPRAKALARKCVINPSPITGTGPNGRIVVKDVETYLAENNYDQLRISPSAKKLAAKEEIDVLSVKSTGSSGRIMINDVKRAVAEKPKTMSKMRQVIARRLTESFTGTPHFYVTVSVDMTDLIAFRQKLKKQDKTISVTAFILEAVVLSLKEFPVVNSVTTDGQTVRWHSSVDLGMAVALDEGLVVPVLKDAEELTIEEIHDLSKKLAVKARDGKLLPDEMTGSTFTVSNMGMLDVEQFNAIINPGEAGILAVSSTIDQPAVKNGKIVIRSMMKITLSVDHRIVDGSTAASFSNAIKEKLEDIGLWKTMT